MLAINLTDLKKESFFLLEAAYLNVMRFLMAFKEL